MKYCSKCKTNKPLIDFNKKTGTKLQSWCRECMKASCKARYAANSEEHKKIVKARHRRVITANRDWYVQEKSKLKCANCPETEAACLDFHHVKGKDRAIGEGLHRGWNIERIKAEMRRCVVICSNCHRKLHAGLIKIDESKTWNDASDAE